VPDAHAVIQAGGGKARSVRAKHRLRYSVGMTLEQQQFLDLSSVINRDWIKASNQGRTDGLARSGQSKIDTLGHSSLHDSGRGLPKLCLRSLRQPCVDHGV